jgi:hypothetical protein
MRKKLEKVAGCVVSIAVTELLSSLRPFIKEIISDLDETELRISHVLSEAVLKRSIVIKF